MVLVAFRLTDSRWPLQVGFPVFMYNTIRYMTGSAMQAERYLQPGQPIDITAPRDIRTLTIETPSHGSQKIETAGVGQARFAATDQVGLYRVETQAAGVAPRTFAVNLADANESDIVPREILRIGSEKSDSPAGPGGGQYADLAVRDPGGAGGLVSGVVRV